jgi:hypothetical protein
VAQNAVHNNFLVSYQSLSTGGLGSGMPYNRDGSGFRQNSLTFEEKGFSECDTQDS